MKIIHRCATCHYPQEYHPQIAYNRQCHTHVDVIGLQPSELIPTIDGSGRIQETVTEPGSVFPGGRPTITTCGCESCWRLYYDTVGSVDFEEMMGS